MNEPKENPEFTDIKNQINLDEMDDSQKEFWKLMTTKEDLHPDLVPYLCKSSFGTSLKHPLYFEIFYSPQFNARINKGYLAKKEYVEKLEAQGDYSGVLGFYERPYRMEKLCELQHDMTDDQYWKTLGWVWTDSENLWQYNIILRSMLNAERPGREKMMNEEEHEFLANLPEFFAVYRGHHGRNRLGFSWSLSHGKALWFANRFDQKRRGVLRATVKKQDVIAVLLGRNEYEVVVDPRNLTEVKSVRKTKRPAWMEYVFGEACVEFELGQRSHHGPEHWERVERNGLAIAKLTKGADKTVVQLFALVHDCKRVNENDDPEHGHRSAAFVEKLHKRSILPLSDEQRRLLVEACKYHNDGQVSDDPTIGACWDSDRLDLTRVGIVPDPKLLSTESAKQLIWRV